MNAVWFFDHWSEWPLTEDEVASEVRNNPRAADEYHLAGSNLTYADYLQNEPSRKAA